MVPGETFFGFDFGNHLFVVLSNPSTNGLVAVVNFTTHGRSATCANPRTECVTVEPGEHPFIRRTSCMYYRRVELVENGRLDETKERGSLRQHAPLLPALLRRVQEGALNSPYVPDEVIQLVRLSLGQ